MYSILYYDITLHKLIQPAKTTTGGCTKEGQGLHGEGPAPPPAANARVDAVCDLREMCVHQLFVSCVSVTCLVIVLLIVMILMMTTMTIKCNDGNTDTDDNDNNDVTYH